MNIESKLYWGLYLSQPIKYPSKKFSVFITLLLMSVSLYLGASISPIYQMVIPFIKEWWSLGYNESFYSYLALSSMLLLIVCCMAIIKGAAFDMACFLKQKHGIRIVP